MDYKEKYEQALMVAKETYDKQPMYREWLEKMFPELAESEDEKVRKVLFEFFKNYKEQDTCGSETFNGIPTDNILAWLEKQGEKSVKWNENTDGNKPQKHHSVLMKTTHGITEGEWNGNEFWIQYRWSSSIKDSDVLFWIELSDIEKQGEQKPTDEEMKTILRSEYEKGRADAIAEMQKEWSEEDSYYRNHIIQIIEEINNAPLKRGEDWEAYINWLKSLRPQNTWKPSDEQMMALWYHCSNGSVLTSLYNNLKKLKEG